VIAWRNIRTAAVVAGVLFLSACAALYSADPAIAAKQQWATACSSTGAVIESATTLYKAGLLSASEADVIDKIDALYRPVCTEDPPPPGSSIQNAAAIAAFKALCPERVPTFVDDWKFTALEGALCASERALLAEAGLQ